MAQLVAVVAGYSSAAELVARHEAVWARTWAEGRLEVAGDPELAR